MWFSPKIATAIDFLLRPNLAARLAAPGCSSPIMSSRRVYSILLCPILWFGHTIFLAGLAFGREIGWIGQTRDDHAVPFTLALHNLWPHTLLGCGALGLLAVTQPAAIPYALFLAAGPASGDPVRDDDGLARLAVLPSGSALAGFRRRPRLPQSALSGIARDRARLPPTPRPNSV